ncbi:MAG: rhodanese-like domain-containing protein [Roseibacillus sp.]
MDPAPAVNLSPDDRMEDLLARLPGARRALFAAYHVGGCQSCSYRDDETLAEVCDRNEIAVEDAIAELLASHERDREMLISPTDLKQRLDAGESVPLFDIRTREEHEAVRLEGSRFLTQELQTKIFATPPDQTIVLYDHRGRDVLDRCAWFRGHGLKNALALAGGIDAWAKEVDPDLQRYRLEIE